MRLPNKLPHSNPFIYRFFELQYIIFYHVYISISSHISPSTGLTHSFDLSQLLWRVFHQPQVLLHRDLRHLRGVFAHAAVQEVLAVLAQRGVAVGEQVTAGAGHVHTEELGHLTDLTGRGPVSLWRWLMKMMFFMLSRYIQCHKCVLL